MLRAPLRVIPIAIVFVTSLVACGDERRDPPITRDGGGRTDGAAATDAESRDAEGEDGGVGTDDGGTMTGCRIDWRPAGLPQEVTEPFDLSDIELDPRVDQPLRRHQLHLGLDLRADHYLPLGEWTHFRSLW
jgi:hypothetical protein